MERRIRIGIDTGGTFTDVVALDGHTGQIIASKTSSTPADPAAAFMAAVGKALDLTGCDGGAVAAVAHGTTVATNQMLEGRVGDLGLITTEGYESVLEIARQSVPDGYGNSYFWTKPPRVVPAHLVKTIRGRLDHRGIEVRPFDAGQAAEVARWFRRRGVTTLGICLLHSYTNPAHELALREVLRREHPEAVVSLSCEVLREYREYERAVTTLVDAAVKPTLSRYIARIAAGLDEWSIDPDVADGCAIHRERDADEWHIDPDVADEWSIHRNSRDHGRIPFYVMKSNGGVLSADEVIKQPITTLLSGPAAGALGATLIARTAGRAGGAQGRERAGGAQGRERAGGAQGWTGESVLTLDGGGTSTDVSIVLGGEPTLTTEGTVGGYPSKIPMIDMVTVGAGGGSVAWVSPEGTLKVGPRSAGADPGPLCYRRGGTEPTVTDAHVLLGAIPPRLLGGEIDLDVDAAREGIGKLGSQLRLGPERCAAGMCEINAWNQANAIRQVTVKRGLDVRDFAMVAFGGSGPLALCRLMDILDLPAAVVPENPANVSAFGLLTVDVKDDYVQTGVARDADLGLVEVRQTYASLEERAAAVLTAEGFTREEHRYLRSADLRYFGQAFEVRVDAPGHEIDEEFRRTVVGRFHDAHERLYGYCYRDDARHAVEWVNFRISGVGPIRRPELSERSQGRGDVERARRGTRPVFVDGWTDTPIYARPDLAPGDVLDGPAVIEEFGSTIPLHPGFTARVDSYGNVVVGRR